MLIKQVTLTLIFSLLLSSTVYANQCKDVFKSKKSPDVSVVELLTLVNDLKSEDAKTSLIAKLELIKKLAELNDSEQLQPLVLKLVFEANQRKMLPVEVKDPKMLEALAEQFYGMIDATLIAYGFSKHSVGMSYKSWDEVAKEHLRLVDQLDSSQGVRSEAFKKGFEKINLARLQRGVSRLLVDGPSSFRTRKRIIESAKSEINLMSWALYDDKTGEWTKDALIKKIKQGVKVRILVDAQTANRVGYSATVKALDAAGAEVILWRRVSHVKKYMGQHRKILISDSNRMVMGGMNHGDVYSHMGKKDKWRDTDVYVFGDAVKEGYDLFARLWNEQIQIHGLKFDMMVQPPAIQPLPKGKNNHLALVDHSPGKRPVDKIYLTYLYSIRSAETQIDIENAYVINTPAILSELQKAVARGVRVRILSNSSESVDEPIVSHPISQSLRELKEIGAEIYLKKGATLHSKFLIVDSYFGFVGSYNLHPRSLRLEGESQLAIFGSKTVDELQAAFEVDISAKNATKAEAVEDIVLPTPFLNGLPEQLFFDQL